MHTRMTSENRTRHLAASAALAAILAASPHTCFAQRILGLDISAYQGNISTASWATLKRPTTQQVNGVFGDGRDFVMIRSSRGGTTGEDHRQGGYPAGNNTFFTASERYDDPYFIQNITRATDAGLFAGAYHFARPDVVVGTVNSDGTTVTVANTGTDEANHFIEMAGPWMRPGYLPPMYDLEAGQTQRTANEQAQFAIDFSNRIYEVMGIRPSMYINGNYSGILSNASQALRDQLAKPGAFTPSAVGPAYSVLWDARYANQSSPESIPIQTGSPKNTPTTNNSYYGPWDDYGDSQPWAFWQYASTVKLNGNNNGNSNTDGDVCRGDMEFLKDQLIPAVWLPEYVNNAPVYHNGDWEDTAWWNSSKAPVQPPVAPGQLTPFATGPLPTPRLPGAATTGPTSGQNDTVILEAPNANFTITHSTGIHNIRKLYMREALNITGGQLVVNYNPNYVSDTVNYPAAARSGPISAQFSGPVTLGGTGSFSVHTLQVDAAQTFTLASSGATLTISRINLMPDSSSPAKILISDDLTINPLNNATATIATGSGPGSTGFIDLGGGTRIFNVGNGSASVDLDVAVPITNGGISKSGAGTMRLSAENSFTGTVTIKAGTLRYGHASGLPDAVVVAVSNGGTLDMNSISDTLASLAGNATGVITQGAAALTLNAPSGINTFSGTITGTGPLTKNGAARQVLAGNNSLGPVAINAGELLFNGTSTTGPVTVNGGTLGGTGSVSGTVTVNSGAHLAPGASIESLAVGALTLNAGSILDIELATPGVSDSVLVSGLLTINGGSLQLTNAEFMAAGTYMLIDYGTISGSIAALGTPTGPAGFKYKLVDTGSVINLHVTMAGDFNNDGKINNADYVVWRKGLGTTYTQNDYNDWRANFEQTNAGSASAAATVPEPASAASLAVVMAILATWSHRRSAAAV